jgi:hypothetical protein
MRWPMYAYWTRLRVSGESITGMCKTHLMVGISRRPEENLLRHSKDEVIHPNGEALAPLTVS